MGPKIAMISLLILTNQKNKHLRSQVLRENKLISIRQLPEYADDGLPSESNDNLQDLFSSGKSAVMLEIRFAPPKRKMVL